VLRAELNPRDALTREAVTFLTDMNEAVTEGEDGGGASLEEERYADEMNKQLLPGSDLSIYDDDFSVEPTSPTSIQQGDEPRK
jgi:hypothetical protein